MFENILNPELSFVHIKKTQGAEAILQRTAHLEKPQANGKMLCLSERRPFFV